MARHGVRAGRTHLESYTTHPAVESLVELIWNALDAEADEVEVRIERDALGDDAPPFVTRIFVSDNGHGIDPSTAVERFNSLGDSWKRSLNGRTLNGRRVLHGKHGRGRFFAFSLGHRVSWQSVWKADDGLRYSTRIDVVRNTIDEFEIAEPVAAEDEPGTTVEIRVEQGRPLRALLDEELPVRVLARLAPHLLGNTDLSVVVDGIALDPQRAIELTEPDQVLDDVALHDLGGHAAPVLRIVEWNDQVRIEMPTLVLCNEGGAALAELDHQKLGSHPVKVTGYVLWPGFEIDPQNLLVAGLAHAPVLDAARQRIEAYVKSRVSELRGSIVGQLQEEGSYPYPTSLQSDDPILLAEQRLYDVVLVAARAALGNTRRERRMTARLMQVAVQERTAQIDDLIDEVLGLPPEVREMLRDLLRDTTLADLVHAGSEVRRRLELVVGLRRILYGPDTSSQMREVDQLHPLVSGNEWLFGEEWRLARSEASLTTVLREVVPDTVALENEIRSSGGRVTRSDGRGGRVDLLLQRVFHGPSGQPERLIVELKRPSLKLTPKELEQVRSYARALERHQGVVNGHWTYWLVGTMLNEDLLADAEQEDRVWGHVEKRKHYDIFVTRWSDLIESAERKLSFLSEQLNIEIEQDEAARRLHERHSDLIPRISDTRQLAESS